jgi:hypothetical protein
MNTDFIGLAGCHAKACWWRVQQERGQAEFRRASVSGILDHGAQARNIGGQGLFQPVQQQPQNESDQTYGQQIAAQGDQAGLGGEQGIGCHSKPRPASLVPGKLKQKLGTNG